MQHAQEMHKFLQQFIKPGDLVFDVGAHIGKKTDLYLNCQANVVCFEPQPQCIAALHKKFDNNAQVAIEQIGLAPEPGILTLLHSSKTPTLSTFCQQWVDESRFTGQYIWDQTFQVPVSTLDLMIHKYGIPQFCKIDVEGFEYEVLQGLTIPIQYIIFEFHIEQSESAHKCLNYLKKLGYTKFNFAIAERGIFLFSQWLSADQLFELLQKEIHNKTWDSIWGLWGDIYACHQDADMSENNTSFTH